MSLPNFHGCDNPGLTPNPQGCDNPDPLSDPQHHDASPHTDEHDPIGCPEDMDLPDGVVTLAQAIDETPIVHVARLHVAIEKADYQEVVDALRQLRRLGARVELQLVRGPVRTRGGAGRSRK